ncbi:unnamed protein product [Tetraodon nigroviridis]|uniref:(spotted green pufferfish) hypothetical protein n=1 Tax=Tetraodon nigroviridis TaxID=99883 RepID=Q4RFM8_TETNG|nr:unnamed protein product [Tetraodon nigroviridis]
MNHLHCNQCYDAHCQVSAKLSDSCVVIKCPKNCGAILHACKQEEHQLLCPNETVACLNVLYGCPLHVQRRRLAKHLEVCPASVVCCSQEWNRWPVSEGDMNFYRKLSENPQCLDNLDVATAVRDQELLFRSIKMKTIFPELIKNSSAEINSYVEKAGCSSVCGNLTESADPRPEVKHSIQEGRETQVKSRDGNSVQEHGAWEEICTKEIFGGKQTVKSFNAGGRVKEEKEASNCQDDKQKIHRIQETPSAVQSLDGTTGLAPWQDGVLERLRKEANIAEYNMYLVHNGAMLINFGQLAACTPREKDFVYGNLEPIEIQTVRTFNIPSSYRAKRHHLKNPAHKVPTKHQSAETADLAEAVQNSPERDEVSATLLCSLEKELKGHFISESVPIDGLYVDTGTQTYNFAAAPFSRDASLADVVAGRPRLLYLHLQTESVTRRHNKTSSAFSHTCGLFFRRDEYRSHYRNVHLDIQSSLCGWFQQRCPLAYLGCTFTQTRFHPAGQQATIKFCQGPDTFVLQPEVPSVLCEGRRAPSPPRNPEDTREPLSSLPLEILQQIAAYLDSFTLSQLSQVSHLMRAVCATLLQERGMVSLKWEREAPSHGGRSWKCQKKANLGVQLSVFPGEQMELQQHSFSVRSPEKLLLLPERGAH